MKIKKILIGLCSFAVLLMLFACQNSKANDKKTSTIETTVRTEMTYDAHYEGVEKYWANYIDTEGKYFVIVKDKSGKEFYRELDNMGIFEQLDDNIVTLWFSGGNGMASVQYFDVENRLVSPIYPNVIFADIGRVVYFDADDPLMLVVCSMFDPEMERVTFKRDFCIYRDIEIPNAYRTSEVSGENSGIYPFTKIKFLDENRLQVKYLTWDRKELDSGFDFVEEILELN